MNNACRGTMHTRNNACRGTIHAEEQCMHMNNAFSGTVHAEEQCMEKNNACREGPFNRDGFIVFTADSCKFLNALDAEHVTLFALLDVRAAFDTVDQLFLLTRLRTVESSVSPFRMAVFVLG